MVRPRRNAVSSPQQIRLARETVKRKVGEQVVIRLTDSVALRVEKAQRQ